MSKENIEIFTTFDADLATFLLLQGIRFRGTDVHSSSPTTVLLQFYDDKQNCRDLERIYLNSDFKKFRDLNKYVLKQIHTKLRERL